jgi:hypothetical protein
MDVWWQSTELWAALLGVLLGFILAEAKDWWARRRRRRAHWGALRVEIEFCRRLAESSHRFIVSLPPHILSLFLLYLVMPLSLMTKRSL